MKMYIVGAALLGLAGCANTVPDTAVSSGGFGQPVSGVTSSNGGGQRAVGNMPSVGVTNGVTTTTGVPATKGATY